MSLIHCVILYAGNVLCNALWTQTNYSLMGEQKQPTSHKLSTSYSDILNTFVLLNFDLDFTLAIAMLYRKRAINPAF